MYVCKYLCMHVFVCVCVCVCVCSVSVQRSTLRRNDREVSGKIKRLIVMLIVIVNDFNDYMQPRNVVQSC